MGCPLVVGNVLTGLKSYSLNIPNQPVVYTSIHDYIDDISRAQELFAARNMNYQLQIVHPL